MPMRTSISFLYDSVIGRLFFNEEPYSIWTCCSNPYSDSSVVSLASSDSSIVSDRDKLTYVNTVPRCKLYRGLIVQGYLISPKFLQSLHAFSVRSSDLFIASYPRSGTTWTEEIVSAIASKMDHQFMSQAVHERVIHLEVGRTFGQSRYLQSLKSPRILSTHLPYTHCPLQVQELKCKVIYVIRNPKDQAVSYYHFHSTAQYLGCHVWQFDQFLSLYMKGIMCYGSWFDHVISWLNASIKYPQSILVISYEELQVNLPAMVKLIANFLDVQLTDTLVASIVKHCQFNAMKYNRAVNREETPLSGLFKASRFMRKGLIGDWKHHFTPEQVTSFDKLFNDKLHSFNLNLPSDYSDALRMFKVNNLRVFDPLKLPTFAPVDDHTITLQPKSATIIPTLPQTESDLKVSHEITNRLSMKSNHDDDDGTDDIDEPPSDSFIARPKLSLIREENGVYDTIKSYISLTNESSTIGCIDENTPATRVAKCVDAKATIVSYNWPMREQSDESVK